MFQTLVSVAARVGISAAAALLLVGGNAPGAVAADAPFEIPVIFPGARGFAIEPGRGGVHAAQVTYFNALKAANIKPDVSPSLIWDPTLLIVDAYRHLGTEATPVQVRNFILDRKGWAGVDGAYDFTDHEHANRGLGQDASVVYHWDDEKEQFEILTKPAGYLK